MASLVPPAAGDRLRRIVVTGPESTGKTLLAQQLAQHYGVPWLPEFARGYAERVSRPLTVDDVAPIARGQLLLEDALAPAPVPFVVQDTDLISTLVYARLYYDFAPEWLAQAARSRLAGLYLLCDVDLPWVADPVRDPQHQRPVMYTAFREQLARFGADYQVVRGTGPERLQHAIGVVDRWLAARR